MVIWFHSLAESEPRFSHLLQEGLAAKGIETREFDLARSPVAGILMIDTYDQAIVSAVRDFTSYPNSRVLVVVLERCDLGQAGAWDLLHAGASDVMMWDGASTALDNLAARLERWNAIDQILASPLLKENLVGQSPAWVRILRQIAEVARFTPASVLITGESGTGKELVARLIHSLNPQPSKSKLIVLDCTTVVPELSGSEFFGHERGAFTGAVSSRDGAFALANKGTLFLDEVGELPTPLQAELLRVVQEHTYKRVGGNTWHTTEFRLVCATNRDLCAERNSSGFRADLYYRIASWSCHLPPLRERREDIPALAEHFIAAAWKDGSPPGISPEVLGYLVTREYPGNVRELRQLVTRMVLRHTGRGPITVGDLGEDERPAERAASTIWLTEQFEHTVRGAVAMGATLKEIRRAAEVLAVRSAIAKEEGNWHRAAQRLGLTDRALQMRRAAWRQKAAAATANSDHLGDEES